MPVDGNLTVSREKSIHSIWLNIPDIGLITHCSAESPQDVAFRPAVYSQRLSEGDVFANQLR
jgi:hypothetical protein